MTEQELERVIAELVARKKELVKRKGPEAIDGAEYAFLQRQLNGLRYSYEEAGPIWEGLDTFGWDATPP